MGLPAGLSFSYSKGLVMVAPINTDRNEYLFVEDSQSILGTFRQVFSATTTFTADYTNWLAEGETLASVFYTVWPATTPAMVVGGSTIDPTFTKVSFQIFGGLDNTRYVIWVNARTSNGQVKCGQLIIQVADFLGPVVAQGMMGASSNVIAQLLTSAAAAASSEANAANSAAAAAALVSQYTVPTGLVYCGTGTPGSAIGVDGDVYCDLNTGNWYGPKFSHAWPTAPFNRPNVYTASAIAPASPALLDKWFDTTRLILNMYVSDGVTFFWLQIA